MQKGDDFIIGGGSAGEALAAFLENPVAEELLPEAGAATGIRFTTRCHRRCHPGGRRPVDPAAMKGAAMHKRVDFIIIRGGSAGAALAAFAENPAAEVLLPKAGGRNSHPGYYRSPPVLSSRRTAACRSSGYEGNGHAEGV